MYEFPKAHTHIHLALYSMSGRITNTDYVQKRYFKQLQCTVRIDRSDLVHQIAYSLATVKNLILYEESLLLHESIAKLVLCHNIY